MSGRWCGSIFSQLIVAMLTKLVNILAIISILAILQAAILVSLVNDLLDISSVRHEIDKREAAGQWVAGKGGAGGSFPMRSEEERARRADADSDAEVSLIACDSSVYIY
jgi:hypothetical protein